MGYNGSTVQRADVKMHSQNVSYALLPVWLLSTKWQNKNYLFAVNGQTGKLVGDLPVSAGRMAAFFAVLFAILGSIGWMIMEAAGGVIAGAVVAAIICTVFYGTMKTANVQTNAHAYIPDAGVQIRHRLDIFTHKTVSRQPINRDSGNQKHR